MKVSKLIEALRKYPMGANARAYEGEVCGVIVESEPGGRLLGVIPAHESEDNVVVPAPVCQCTRETICPVCIALRTPRVTGI